MSVCVGWGGGWGKDFCLLMHDVAVHCHFVAFA